MFAERPILLRTERRLARRTVRLAGTAPWSCAPLELRIVDGTVNRQVTWLEVGEADAVELPFLLGAEAWVDVFGRGRHPIVRVPLDPHRAPAVIDVELPRPIEKVVVVHGPVGTPRPGASVLSRFHGELFSVAITDARGRATFFVGADTKLGAEEHVFVRASESGMGVSLRSGSLRRRIDASVAEPSDQFVALGAAADLHGRVLGLDDVAGVRVLAGFGTSNTPADWQYASEPAERIAATDRNAIRVFAPDERGQRLMLTTMAMRRWVRSDEDGRFVLPMPPEAMPDLTLHVREGMGIDIHRLQWTGESQQDVILRQRF